MLEVEKIVDLAIRVRMRAAHEAVPDDADVELFHKDDLCPLITRMDAKTISCVWRVSGNNSYLRFPLAPAFLGLGFADFLTGSLATFLPSALLAFLTGFLAAFTFTPFFTVLFAAFFATLLFAGFFAGRVSFFLAGFGGFVISAASIALAGLASAASASRQPWASRTEIMADKMSFQVCCCIITSLGNMQPSQQM